jgi:Fe-S-cluster containining protein
MTFTVEEALAEVRAVYAALADRPVERNCTRRTECCQFNLTGRTPYLTKGEALLAARALRATGRKKSPTPKHDGCPLLDGNTGRCLIYESRPFGCRTHFCREAGGPYARGDVRDLIRRLEIVDAQLAGNGPVALPVALARALRELSGVADQFRRG